ncbi:MAG TPA: hypothetical protein VMU82_14665, partial [Acetobacteraceae bacterium]|nr:hypothetical protein [Acetobacteraceae bacterium]
MPNYNLFLVDLPTSAASAPTDLIMVLPGGTAPAKTQTREQVLSTVLRTTQLGVANGVAGTDANNSLSGNTVLPAGASALRSLANRLSDIADLA